MFSFIPYIDLLLFPSYVKRVWHGFDENKNVNIVLLFEIAQKLIGSDYDISCAWIKNGTLLIPISKTDILTLGSIITGASDLEIFFEVAKRE